MRKQMLEMKLASSLRWSVGSPSLAITGNGPYSP